MANDRQLQAQQFKDQFNDERTQSAIRAFFDKEADMDRFTAVVTRAVQENPDLLAADRTSLFFACQKAAQDHLIPDGKEGFLAIYNVNEGNKDNPKWIKKVQWQPMIGGLRKILAEFGISIRAEIVYEKDEFVYNKGDNPSIIHRPQVFGDRGPIIGAYAIATDSVGNMYRETMDMVELEKVHQASKQPNSGVWRTWATEMYRKAVAKRLFKHLPLISDAAGVIDRDNEQFDMNKPTLPSQAAQDVQAAIRLAAPSQAYRIPIEPLQETIAANVEGDQHVISDDELENRQDESIQFDGQQPDF